VLAPEHELVLALKKQIINWEEVIKYTEEVKKKTEIERTTNEKNPSTGSEQAKTGVELKGIKAINPANGKDVPIFVADYVLGNYGTGAVMAVPAHDERDFAFAKKYSLPIKQVIAPYFSDPVNPFRPDKKIVFRKVVHSIIINPKNNKILCLEWKKFPWNTFVIGGIEGNETNIEAALREIKEETGYKNLKFIKKLAGPFINEFYAAHKDINRTAQVDLLLFELENEEVESISEEENSKHKVVWIEKNELRNFIKGIDEKEYEIEAFDRGEETYFTGEGVMVNSPGFELIKSEKAREKITEKFGRKAVKFKLRDWVFSRQRYWGEPIPVVHCEKCGIVPLKEKDLPLKLPEVKNYQPTDNGESPLADISKWVNTKCPKCGGKARRETDTMPNWAGSSWYFLRYTDPRNNKKFADLKKLKYWMQVDWYNGGMEHTTLHLLYSRFWNKFFYDIGLVPTSEPYKKRTSHGFILASNGEKMSKSRGNVINPDSVIEMHGADTLRLYEMFMGPFDQMISWSDNNIIGVRRFVERIWKMANKVESQNTKHRVRKKKSDIENNNFKFENLLNKTIKKVGGDIESMSFNTAVSSMMILANEMEKMTEIPQKYFEMFLAIMSPFAPHITEELWHKLGHKTLLVTEKWPKFDESKITSENTTIMVQINGKIRAQFKAETGILEAETKLKALALPEVKKWLVEKKVKKVVFVPNKIINFVV
jgi:leucyl-tRNA synthetase